MTDDDTAPAPMHYTRSVLLSRVPRELQYTPRIDREDAAAALALINRQYALAPLSEGDVELRRMALAHSAVDRTGERFGLPFLGQLAATLPGKPVLAHHDHRSWPLGRFYSAETVEDTATGVTWLVARWYLLKTPENEPLRRQMDAGIVSHVSIGFRGGELVCDLCGEPFWGDCPHWPGQEVTRNGAPVSCSFEWTDPRGTAEAVEGSLVWLGAQQGARIIKHLEEDVEESLLARELKSQLVEARSREEALHAARSCLEKELTEWQGRHRAAELRATELQSERAQALAQAEERTAKARGLEPLAADGQLYRDDLVTEIRRLAGIIDAASEAEVLCEALKDAGALRLKRARDEYQRRVDLKLPPAGTGLPLGAADPTPRAATPRHPRAHTLV